VSLVALVTQGGEPPTLFTPVYFQMARATGIFTILSVQDIEDIVARAVALLKEGKTMMEYTDSGTTVVKGWPLDIQTVMIEARYALQLKDPQRYGQVDKVRVYNGLNNFRSM
jgi:hypothetical protein